MRKTEGVQWESNEAGIWQAEEGRNGQGELPGRLTDSLFLGQIKEALPSVWDFLQFSFKVPRAESKSEKVRKDVSERGFSTNL